MKRIQVRTSSASYSVVCGHGLLPRAEKLLREIGGATGTFVVSSPRVWKACGKKVAAGLRGQGRTKVILFDDAEPAKTLASVEKVCRALIRDGADRDSLLIAVGGGVVGDVAGFVAASYMRGIRLVHVPTTLVAQVDSAIGGKTGVNLPEGKNLVGAFCQPALVLADPEVLRTLPPRQFRSGLYEVIKYGVIGDARLFRFLEEHLEDALQQRRRALDWILPRCMAAKARIVSRDEREAGLRAILNFGHTVGHALETASGYKRFLHGEAVGWGMIAATRIAMAGRQVHPREALRIEALVRRVGPLPALPAIAPASLLAIMRGDKKARSGKLRFVLPRRIGKVEIVSAVPDSPVLRVLKSLSSDEWAQVAGGRR